MGDGDLLYLLRASESTAETLKKMMNAAYDHYQDVTLQSLYLAGTGDMLHIRYAPETGVYRLALGSVTLIEGHPDVGQQPIHLADLGGNRLLLTVAAPMGGTQDQLWELRDGKLIPWKDTDTLIYINSDLLLPVPSGYGEKLIVERPGYSYVGGGADVLFTVLDRGSYEAEQWQTGGADPEAGELFRIRRVDEETLGKLMTGDMGLAAVFAREQTGYYLILQRAGEGSFVPDDPALSATDDPRWPQWEALNDWAAAVPEAILDANPTLVPYARENAAPEIWLARLLYGESAALLRLEEGPGEDPLGTPAQRSDAYDAVWKFGVTGPAAASDEPADRPCFTLLFAEADTELTWRMNALDGSGQPLSALVRNWYFDFSLVLSGRTTALKNGELTLNVPTEFMPLLSVESGAEDGSLFSVTELESREAGQTSHPGDGQSPE